MATAPPQQLRSPARSVVADFVTLTKPRIMLLILITAYGAMAFAAGGFPPADVTIATLFGLGLSSGGASALNHCYDRDIDALMHRTALRPIPAGRVAPDTAMGFGIGLIVSSFAVLGLYVNLLTALLAVGGAVFYVVVYTIWLKRRTTQNIVIGGAAGAFPPMIGWAAATGTVSLESVILFLVVFLWTPPHFWALALFKSGEYARAGIPMMPNVAGDAATRRQIFVYTLLVAPVGVLPWLLGYAGMGYGLVAAALGAGFLWHAWSVLRMTAGDAGMRPAKALFGFSLLYLFGIFAAYLGDQMLARWSTLVGA